MLDRSFHLTNKSHYPADKCQGTQLHSLAERDSSSGSRDPTFKQLEPGRQRPPANHSRPGQGDISGIPFNELYSATQLNSLQIRN